MSINTFLNRLLAPSAFKRFLFFFLADSAIIAVSLYLSFLFRFEFRLSSQYEELFVNSLPFFIVIKLITFASFRMYKITWRYVGIGDLVNIVYAISVSSAILMVLILIPLPAGLESLSLLRLGSFPRSIFLMDGIISLVLLSGVRISKRLYLEIIIRQRSSLDGKRAIVIGAGNTGDMVLRDMARQSSSEFTAVSILDDDTAKIGGYLHGIKVYGAIEELKNAVTKFAADAVIIAIPSLDHKTLRNIYSLAKDANVGTIKIVPRIYDFHKPNIKLKALEEIRIEDLIGRQAVSIDYEGIVGFLQDKTILITGAGGSIGSEIARQVCAFYPRELVMFDIDETDLHALQLYLKRNFMDAAEKMHFVPGDIRDEQRVEEVMNVYAPDIVFHAAAYKHVPMMEYNPKEAVKVNMFGTHIVAKAAVNAGVRKFVMISTDKAVRPTSIMGATKRMAENICKSFNNYKGQHTEFVSVRFGNVLGSRGSVLPIFLEQLKYGGPLTVTHKDMMRYFMTIPEAVSLVLQASTIGKGGEVLVLDMGEPVRIVDFAEELIRLHGMEPYRDIDIEFVGLRPGEKLFEEILTAEEGTTGSSHEKVFVSKNSEKHTVEDIEVILQEFNDIIHSASEESNRKVKLLLRKHVKHFEGEQDRGEMSKGSMHGS